MVSRRRIAQFLAAWLVGVPALADETPVELSLDPHLSIETGADLTSTTVAQLARLEERAFRPLEERPAAGIPLRGLRAALFDAPVAWWFGVVEHEVFGHGGRAREFGSEAGYHLGSPWSGRESYATFETRGLTTDDLLRIYAGGAEGNGFTATVLERELAAGRPARPLTLLLVASSRFVTSDYVLRTTPDPVEEPAAFYSEWVGGGDVANYLGYLHTRFHGEPGITPTGSSAEVVSQWRRLRRQAVWNAFDPGAWLSLWSAGRHVLTGEDPPPVPLLRLKGHRVLPILSADWLPDGGISSVETVVSPMDAPPDEDRARWWSLVLRRGRGPGGGFGAAGAATECLWSGEKVRVGGEVEAWARPGRGIGGGGRVRFVRTSGRTRGLFLEVGIKSAGHWPGRPAGTGPMFRFGGIWGDL